MHVPFYSVLFLHEGKTEISCLYLLIHSIRPQIIIIFVCLWSLLYWREKKHTNCAVLEIYVFNINKHFARASAFRCTCSICETSVTDRLPMCVFPYNVCNKRKMHKLSLKEVSVKCVCSVRVASSSQHLTCTADECRLCNAVVRNENV